MHAFGPQEFVYEKTTDSLTTVDLFELYIGAVERGGSIHIFTEGVLTFTAMLTLESTIHFYRGPGAGIADYKVQRINWLGADTNHTATIVGNNLVIRHVYSSLVTANTLRHHVRLFGTKTLLRKL